MTPLAVGPMLEVRSGPCGQTTVEESLVADIRVLVVSEPRAYREVMAAALRSVRPSAIVDLGDPDTLESDVLRLHPHLVVCSRLLRSVDWTYDWILVYPHGGEGGLMSVGGELVPLNTVDFPLLLSVVDKVQAGPQAA